MNRPSPSFHAAGRLVWLCQVLSANPCVNGCWKGLSPLDLGHAGVRETFTMAAQPFAGVWATHFRSILAPSGPMMELRDDGPGVGRDARVAYLSLLGYYLARANLISRNHNALAL